MSNPDPTKAVNEILRDYFCRADGAPPPEEVREDALGSYTEYKDEYGENVWLSPAFMAELLDEAYTRGFNAGKAETG